MMNEDPSGDIENQGASADRDESGNNHPNKKWKVIALSASLLLIVVLAIVLGVTLPSSGGSDASSNNNDNLSVGDRGGELEVGGDATTETTITTATATTPSSSISSATNPTLASVNNEPFSTIAPTTFNELTSDDPSTTQSNDINETSPPTTITQPADDETTSTTTDTTAPAAPITSTTTTTLPTTDAAPKEDVDAPMLYEVQYLASEGPILSKVRKINPGVANGYNSCDDLREDMLDALKHYANTLIVQESKNNWHEKCDPNNPKPPYWYGDYSAAPVAMEMAKDEGSLESSLADSSGAAGDAGEPKEDSFDTNNQVDGVDEADVVKSDGDYVYAAYGDLLYVWNATDGPKGISITPMPYEEVNETECTYTHFYVKDPWFGEPTLVDEDVSVSFEDNPLEEDEEVEAISFSSGEARKKDPDSPGSVRKRNRRNHRSRKALSLSPGSRWNPCRKPKPRILSLLLEGSRLTVIVSEDNYYRHYYPSKDGDESKPSIVNDDVKLTIRVYDVSNVPTDGDPLALLGEKEIAGQYDSARSIGETGLVITTSYINTYSFGQDLYRHHDRYCGLNSTEYETLAAETALNNTASFLDRMLEDMKLQLDGSCDGIFQVAAMQSGDSDEDQNNGDLLSQFVQVSSFNMSSDFGANGEITTNVAGAFSSGWLSSVYASQGFVATLNEGSNYNATADNWDSATFILGFDISGTTPRPFCYAEVQGRPGLRDNPYVTDLYQGHLRVVTTEENWSNSEGSRTTNKIYILRLPREGEGQEMIPTAVTDHLGKPNERVEAIRYIGPKAYVVTFERTDPFYIFDLEDPYDPKKLGELEVPGFSSYLHPVQIDGVDLMLGIGVHVDPKTARRVGLKISLYDVSNATNPTENATYIDEDAYSSSGDDFKAFRFLAQSKKLIIPKREYNYGNDENFDGFVVYNISLGSVAPSYEIEHASSYAMNYGCWYNARMPARSFVFQSKVTTILSHSVISTDLVNGDRLWNVTLGDGVNTDDCWSYF